MSKIRTRLTYANVMSSLAIFLVLGGASAYAAKKIGSHQLKSNSITTAKIKKNAVTTAKVKKNAITTAKIKNGAINGAKIADGSVTGTDINAPSTPFSQTVARVRGGSASFTPGPYLFGNPTFTQNAGEDAQFVGGLDVTFAASCEPPRSATAFLLLDAATPGVPAKASEIIGLGVVEDTNSGEATRRMEFAPFPGFGVMSKFAPNAATQHTFSVFLSGLECKSGSGGSVAGAGVDVIGTK